MSPPYTKMYQQDELPPRMWSILREFECEAEMSNMFHRIYDV